MEGAYDGVALVYSTDSARLAPAKDMNLLADFIFVTYRLENVCR